jgi:hypothetical protein
VVKQNKFLYFFLLKFILPSGIYKLIAIEACEALCISSDATVTGAYIKRVELRFARHSVHQISVATVTRAYLIASPQCRP